MGKNVDDLSEFLESFIGETSGVLGKLYRQKITFFTNGKNQVWVD